MHYKRWRSSPEGREAFRETDAKRVCAIADCGGVIQSRGWCQKHYVRWRVHGDPLAALYNMDGPKATCEVESCEREVHGNGLCGKHYQRQTQGRPLEPERERGDGWINLHGYVFTQVDGRAVAMHRLVMERILGRELLRHETVHHKNGDRRDNRPENLELWSSSHPRGQRAWDKLGWARDIIALYEPDKGRLAR